MEWISVNDRLPEQEGDYLFFLESGDISTGYYCEGYDEPDKIGCGSATHWMPLPEPPKGV